MPRQPERLVESRPQSRRRPYRSQTRRRVLDAAFEVFGRQGIAASSLSEVAAAADLTKGAVYSSFASKDELVLALMEDQAGQRIEASLAVIERAEALSVTEVGQVLVRAMHADAAWHRLLAEYFALSYQDSERRAALRQRRREVREAVARALAGVSERLEIEFPMPPDDLAVVLLALSNGLAVESEIDPDGVPDDLLGRVLGLIAGAPDAP
ncbi:MAG: TetR/AcrR family transcriptional regulator [Nocardioidaceae bacterium]